MSLLTDRRVVLASGSERRKELLSRMGISYVVRKSDADESYASDPEDTVLTLARRKGRVVAETEKDAVVISADTMVSVGGKLLGKPTDCEDAKAMLFRLSGRGHQVYTGVCVIDTRTGAELCEAVRTDVYFREMSGEEIDEYVRSGDPLDKAGAYGIQSGASKFVEKIEGELENVIGLPVTALRRMLCELERRNGDVSKHCD